MKEEKINKLEQVITSTDPTRNSCKAYQSIRKLINDPTSTNHPCLVNTNQVAHQLLVNGLGMSTKPKRPVLPIPSLVSSFSEEDYIKGITALKYNKAACIDDVLVEQPKNLGLRAHKWLLSMLRKCLTDNKIPKHWRQSKIIAILKPGSLRFQRAIDQYPSYDTHKLYERMILNRVTLQKYKHQTTA